MKTSIRIVLCLAVVGLPASGRAAEPAPLPVALSAENFQVLLGPTSLSEDALSGKLALEITTGGKWKFNEKAKNAVDLTAPASVKLDKVKLSTADLVQNKPKLRRYEVPFRAAVKGKHELKLKLDFVICNEELCQKKKLELPYTLNAG